MTEPGLNSRLRQRSRRAGIMIGISMALTIAVCVGSFSVLYASLNGVVSDFVTEVEDQPTATVAAAPTEADVTAAQPAEAAPEPTAAPDSEQDAAPTEEPQPTEQSQDEQGEFNPDYQIASAPSVNLREGPSVQNSASLGALNVDTPLQFLDETTPSTDLAGDGMGEGQLWMLFRTEDGEEGWIRDIDVVEFSE